MAAQAGTGVKKMLTHIKAELAKAGRQICQCSPGSRALGEMLAKCSAAAVRKRAYKPKLLY